MVCLCVPTLVMFLLFVERQLVQIYIFNLYFYYIEQLIDNIVNYIFANLKHTQITL